MKYYKNLALSLLAALILTPAFAGENDTASYYRAHFEDYAGKSVSVDVAFLRVLPVDIGDDYFAFVVATVNDEDRSGGGGIAVVAPKDKKNSIVNKYGTSAEREGKRSVETKKLTGTLESISKEGAIRYTPYIDMTDGAFEPNEAFGKAALSAKGFGGKGKKGLR